MNLAASVSLQWHSGRRQLQKLSWATIKRSVWDELAEHVRVTREPCVEVDLNAEVKPEHINN